MNTLLGRNRQARLGSLLLVAGLSLLMWAALWQVGLVPGSRVVVPEPVALQRSGSREAVAEVPPSVRVDSQALTAQEQLAPGASAEPFAIQNDSIAPALPLVAADQADRRAAAAAPKPGYATRLSIASIGLETEVRQAGVKRSARGEPEWETLPFAAAHYGDLTALVGARGNAVIAGHVVTLNEGNVFRNLYRVELGNEITVWDDRGHERRFTVTEVRLVTPDDVSVMEQTPLERLTLITCGGTFDPVKREFSDRFIVVARPLA